MLKGLEDRFEAMFALKVAEADPKLPTCEGLAKLTTCEGSIANSALDFPDDSKLVELWRLSTHLVTTLLSHNLQKSHFTIRILLERVLSDLLFSFLQVLSCVKLAKLTLPISHSSCKVPIPVYSF